MKPAWVDGMDLAEVLPGLHPTTQYQLGLEAGRRLPAIHNFSHPP